MTKYEVSGQILKERSEQIEASSPHQAARMFREKHPGFDVDFVETDRTSLASHGKCESCSKEVFENDEYQSCAEDGIVVCKDCCGEQSSP